MEKVINLDKKHAAALRKLNDMQMGIKQFVDAVTSQGEVRFRELQTEGREIWQTIAKDYKLDLEKCAYTLSEDGTKLILTSVRYDNASGTK